MKKSNKTETDMKIFSDTMNQLIREKKIEFGFYDNKLVKLELLQICYDKSKDKLEIEFRDVVGDYLREWIRMEFRGSAEHGGTRQEVVWMNYSLEKEGQMSIEDFLHD